MVIKESLVGEYTSPYWGEPNSPIDWCEDNYDTSNYIAEIWNTFSNIGFIFGAYIMYREAKLHNLPNYYTIIALSLFLTGFTSALFHASLYWIFQKLDEICETFMVTYICAFCVYIYVHTYI